MSLHPFGRFSTIRWPLLAGVFLVAAGVLPVPAGAAFLSAGQLPTKPNEKIDFKGKWDGTYLDNKNGKGQVEYEFGEEKDGRLTVKVSWKEDQMIKTMTLTGERAGPDAIRLEDKSGNTSYRYIGGMEKNVLVLHWIAENGQSEKPYFGVSWLTRQKK